MSGSLTEKHGITADYALGFLLHSEYNGLQSVAYSKHMFCF